MNHFDPAEFVTYLALAVWGLALGIMLVGLVAL